jgi:hypothetical protein
MILWKSIFEKIDLKKIPKHFALCEAGYKDMHTDEFYYSSLEYAGQGINLYHYSEEENEIVLVQITFKEFLEQHTSYYYISKDFIECGAWGDYRLYFSEEDAKKALIKSYSKNHEKISSLQEEIQKLQTTNKLIFDLVKDNK